ncbi:lipoprotein insertase outer membrane protein LolB [Thalassomonas sp. M1454]|uniref:lipoprotein insertase outer membrane protein LolB n=1 Tax=Thalassomonas sp. M1454 TaxID=2594477 RepID=UPI001180A602|nr:lipoprotein insertase outer membrane protein LolB [Thalassomonas sp. M1454]TRX56401.1 outer membrane lipoprotein LolB [Thalassomonas sp. M1454]
MPKFQQLAHLKLLCALIIAALFSLSGCSSTPEATDAELFQDENQRSQQLENVTHWTIKGKIAFISPQEKQSANLFWQQQQDKITLKLTTFLGVNVLSLNSDDGLYTLKADGKTWRNENLDQLLSQVTNLNLPVNSLIYWVKGLKASNDDIITYSATNALPSQLQAWANNKFWQIEYQSYRLIDQYRLANKLTVKHNDLTIKMAISSWEIN